MGSLAALGALVLLTASAAVAQSAVDAAGLYVRQNAGRLGLAAGDLDGLAVAHQSVSRVSGVTHVYFQQTLGGVPVHDGIVNVAVDRAGRVLSANSRAVANVGRTAQGARVLSADAAVRTAASSLGFSPTLEVARDFRGLGEGVVFRSDLASDDILARLRYVPAIGGPTTLAWLVDLSTPEDQRLWQVAVDAGSGAILGTGSLTDEDHWAADDHLPEGWAVVAPVSPASSSTLVDLARLTGTATIGAQAGVSGASAQYRVYAGAVESPSHGGDPYTDLRTLATGVNATASPLGWHNNGSTSFTITRGNNVHAGLDLLAPDGIEPGTEAEGGPSLLFDFAFDPGVQSPDAYRPAAVTNLFYWNNIVHDVAWFYGFDEPSGNFQATNTTGFGAGNDAVNAQTQDYSGTNNANFSTPVDGSAPRMQMYVWGTALVNEISFGTTTDVMSAAAFGVPFPTTGVTLDVALVNDGTALPNEGCGPLVNAAEVAGKFALVYRGSCAFTIKVKNAQDAGALGAIVINNAPGNPGTLGGADATVVIPAGMISNVTGAALVAALPTAATVRNLGQSVLNRDSDFDNGVIVHEYGHGISNRLTGGPATTSCLATNYTVGGVPFTSEQMGEGWSDYYALLLTDTNTDGRGIGTYLNFEPTTGQGIRPYRYSTSFGTNPATYDYIKTASAPHGVGFVWASMAWDMTRALVDRHGWDPDVYTGTGGNNLALALVTEGLKIQPCRPGFVDGRDAILTADVAITGGANQCLIWDAFSRRGLGASADQGAYYDRLDGTEAFDLPTSCSTSSMIIDAVNALKASGAITNGQATQLIAKITIAQARLDAARPRPAIALNRVEAFSASVRTIGVRRLTDEEEQYLLDLADGFTSRILEQYPGTTASLTEFGVTAGLEAGDLPSEFALDQSAPNPASGGSAEISFALPEAARVRLVVYDVMGRAVAEVADGQYAAGFHQATVDVSRLASGTYVYRLEAGDFVATRQMTVIR
ncbi:M36 family metallopeptidase [Rubrivirga marina]|uniref:PA domain-containing protein n=1 Tax=Rubrivirga marina TaxID=1196024 RepID=A0A271IZ11_9BACT|nr:M36 family metallopeptidase [Rubrivirga marina]PAP76491.1 hypothetical protein BSZ37_08580 [Rubrivirga marina]